MLLLFSIIALFSFKRSKQPDLLSEWSDLVWVLFGGLGVALAIWSTISIQSARQVEIDDQVLETRRDQFVSFVRTFYVNNCISDQIQITLQSDERKICGFSSDMVKYIAETPLIFFPAKNRDDFNIKISQFIQSGTSEETGPNSYLGSQILTLKSWRPELEIPQVQSRASVDFDNRAFPTVETVASYLWWCMGVEGSSNASLVDDLVCHQPPALPELSDRSRGVLGLGRLSTLPYTSTETAMIAFLNETIAEFALIGHSMSRNIVNREKLFDLARFERIRYLAALLVLAVFPFRLARTILRIRNS